ncbi:hypothetical protein [Acanthopleuribacter pedis]|uniref:Uncharacterized protein n=1 Tax=Acanthopleuribacter pedis TaxID=442870 RepID=A0A8J7U5L2_9BACT|nr:hypothetical protein [Acanthopleuribacter pedis]MBO1320969.1 hypothetical protein [Acanthopleuribacter pedis]
MLDPEVQKVVEEEARRNGDDPAELEQISARLRDAAQAWQDEGTPPWPRLPMATSTNPSTPRWFTQWLPAFLCILMFALLVGQSRVISDAGGWRIEFGAPAAATETATTTTPEQTTDPDTITLTRAELADYLDQRFAEQNKRMLVEFRKGLSDYHENQETYLTSLFEFQKNEISNDRARDMERLVNNWQRQRLTDLDNIEDRMAFLVDQQSLNNDTLYDLANAVQRAPSDD